MYSKVAVVVHTPEALHAHISALGQAEVQSEQTPLAPQSVLAVPPTQVPSDEQQPPLQVCVEEHVVVQVLLLASHACPVGQSLAVMQPHRPVGRHALPSPPVLQSTHAWPIKPHAPAAVPGAQRAPLQHPPLQS